MFYVLNWTRTREEGATKFFRGSQKKFHFFRHSPLYNYKFYFYIWVTLAGIAQLVEHDLAKVGVEGPSPFSRSKKPPTKVVFFFYIVIWTRTREEGAAKFGSCTKCEETNFALDANAVAQARRGKGQPRSGDWTLTIPFPARK